MRFTQASIKEERKRFPFGTWLDGSATSNVTTVDVTVNPVGSAPTVAACAPNRGSGNERLTVVVSGTNFQSGATVDFGQRVTVQSLTFVSPTELRVQVKVHRRAAVGPRDVTVTNPDGLTGTSIGCFAVT